ncbi:putative RNA-directed DNA polymerase [Tanacetum coccineum]|uniref:RNA-directed DNA polymerase n=1 Tax=Tanacetum coccineum TaxID=301880 RepID=A0ABQ5EEL9_9ASTR
MESIRLLIALAAKENWIVHHLDMKSSFLNMELKEEVYVTQPTGFDVKVKEEMVYKLHKALYGLRQAPRSWNAKLDKVQDFKVRMNSIFDMSDLGKLNYYLGIEVKQEENNIIIKQENYARKILEEAGMSNCNPAKWPMDPKLQLTKDEGGKEVDPTKYRRIIESLRYLINTRLDLSYLVGVVSKFMQSPRESHYAAVKKILQYLKGTTGYGLKYRKGGNGKIYGSCEAEFMAATAAACQALWLRNMVGFLTGEGAQRVQLLGERDQVYVEHVCGDLQKADILTKALPRVKFTEMRRLIGAEDVNIKRENAD